MKIQNIRIGARLAGGFSVVVGLFLVTLLQVGLSLNGVTQDVKQIKEETLPYVLIVDQMDTDRAQVQQFLTDVSATHDPAGYKDAEDAAKSFLSGVAKFKQMYQREGNTEKLKEMEIIEADFNRFYAKGKTMAEAYINQGIDAGNAIMETFDKDSEAVSEKLGPFRKHQTDEANAMAANTLSSAESSQTAMIWTGLVVAALAGFLSFFITRSVTLPMNMMHSTIVTVGKNGDFTQRIAVQGHDEVGQTATAFNDLMAALQNTLRQIHDGIDEINNASRTLSSVSHQVADSSAQQSEAASSIAATVEQVTVSINHVSDSASDALKISRESGELSAQGGEIIHNAAGEMQKIAETVRQTSLSIEELGKQSAQISSIAQVIKEIADQTNLLALNAAIEAARAGEQGRGFAVVADEVRKLAERTGNATKEISEMIGGIQSTAQVAVTSMSGAVGQVGEGVALAEQAGDAINQIKAKSAQVLATASDISAALEEQSKASNDIAVNIEKVAQMTEQNSAATNNTSNAADHLSELAESMRVTVDRFKI
ncbi:MAG: methyl-accepting chemotaxis protein [Nitrosomonadales bacterium]|nr:methyl-accepting chemotaxis protein [Nitrosomonadales bacterium]